MPSAVVYATAAQLRAMPNITASDDDTVLDQLLSAASRAIDGYCNRNDNGFVADDVATERILIGQGSPFLSLPECVEVTAIHERSRGETSWEAVDIALILPYHGGIADPDYNSFPYNGLLRTTGSFPDGRDLTSSIKTPGYPTVKVTARYGYADVLPPQVVTATLIQASRWFKRGQAAWADTIANDSMGSLQFRKSIDPDVQTLLNEGRLRRTLYG